MIFTKYFCDADECGGDLDLNGICLLCDTDYGVVFEGEQDVKPISGDWPEIIEE